MSQNEKTSDANNTTTSTPGQPEEPGIETVLEGVCTGRCYDNRCYHADRERVFRRPRETPGDKE